MKPFFTKKDDRPLAQWSDDILTEVMVFNGWCAKRDDLAGWVDSNNPSGSKWRQYLSMAKAHPGKPMLVGLASSFSAMQIYVAAAAKMTGVESIIYIPTRKEKTAATIYALEMGAEVYSVPIPAWPSRCRSMARKHGQTLGGYVKWDHVMALRDAAYQCQNIPHGIKRVVVPTGSGLTAAGVLAGLAITGSQAKVLAVAVSKLASIESITTNAHKLTDAKLPRLELVRASGGYGDWLAARLPDNTPLDPYYSAKALSFVKKGDCLWLPGLRPLAAMPEQCREALGD